jgi:hypothetical protein
MMMTDKSMNRLVNCFIKNNNAGIMLLLFLVAIKPRKQTVYPPNSAMEPSVAAGGLSSETEQEFAKGILAERQSYIHEIDMLIAFGVGILDGMPDGDIVRV